MSVGNPNGKMRTALDKQVDKKEPCKTKAAAFRVSERCGRSLPARVRDTVVYGKMSSLLVDAKLKRTSFDVLSVAPAPWVNVEAAAPLAATTVRSGGTTQRGVGNDQGVIDQGRGAAEHVETAAQAVAAVR